MIVGAFTIRPSLDLQLQHTHVDANLDLVGTVSGRYSPGDELVGVERSVFQQFANIVFHLNSPLRRVLTGCPHWRADHLKSPACPPMPLFHTPPTLLSATYSTRLDSASVCPHALGGQNRAVHRLNGGWSWGPSRGLEQGQFGSEASLFITVLRRTSVEFSKARVFSAGAGVSPDYSRIG